MAQLTEYRCTAAGFSIPMPQGWEISEEVEGAALVALEPDRGDGGFRSNVVVTVESTDLDLPEWAAGCVAALQQSLNRCRVLDTEDTGVGGLPARRALLHYVHLQVGGMNLEQWALRRGDEGFVVSATTAVPDYDDRRELMALIAGGLQVAER